MTREEAPRLILVGPPMAPPVELNRWLRDRFVRPYEFQKRAAGLHAFASIRRKVPIELPLLLYPEGAVGGLWNSIEALADELPSRNSLFPAPGDESFARDLCDNLFSPAVQSFYHAMLPARSVLARRATHGVPRLDALFVRLLYPFWRRMMTRGLKLQAFNGEAAAQSIDACFRRVEGELGGQPFLGGSAPGIRDIVFAVLASPIILPEGHPASIPTIDELPAAFRDQVHRWRAHPAGALALRIYEHRPPSIDWGRDPRDRLTIRQRATPVLLRAAFRFAASFAPRTLKLRKNVYVPRFADVSEVLARDSDFLIGPVNRDRIAGVMGPFILGMDASPELTAQREAAYAGLRSVDSPAATALVAAEAERLASAAFERFGAIDVVGAYARPIAARAAVLLFGVQGPSETDLMRAARAVFHETFLNITGDKKVEAVGRAAGKEIAQWIEAEVTRRQGEPMRRDLIGSLVAMAGSGRLERKQISWITAGMLVGAIDTTATAVANIVAEIASNDALGTAMRRDIEHPQRFTGWCWEVLRRRPHNPLLIRETAADVVLAGKTIPKDSRVWALTLGAMQDARVFPEPRRLRPDRPQDLYMHFGAGLHRCSGRELNGRHIPLLVATLLRHGLAGPHDLRFRGPFPDRLVVQLKG